MKKYIVFLIIVLTVFIASFCAADIPVYQNQSAPIEDRIEDLLSRMTLEEKAAMLSGDSTRFDSKPNARLGIPALRMTDGPVGVRWERSTAFPVSVCMVATWNPDLIYTLGQALGQEAKAKGRNVLLGPCVNIHRVPQGGRNFESFGEDPYLASRIVANYVKGVQSGHVIATVKHFACNNQEFERSSIDVKIDERTLHEIYLPAFRAAVQKGGAWAVMSAYNRINGQYCSSNTHLLTDILKNCWGFQGFVMSDWGAVHSVVPTLYAGLDIEMPTGRYLTVDNVRQALREGRMKPSKIDDKVRRMLRAMFSTGIYDQTVVDSGACDTPEHRAIALKVAREGMTLLKNENDILPIRDSKVKSIAVIGPLAANLSYGGGGSSHVTPIHTISPLEGLQSKAGKNFSVQYAEGTFFLDNLSTIPSECLLPPGENNVKHGLLGTYYANDHFEGEPVKKQIDPTIDFDWNWSGPSGMNPEYFSVIWEGRLQAPEDGDFVLAIGSDDGSRLYINGKMEIDNWGGHAVLYKFAKIPLEKEIPVDIRIEYNELSGGAGIHLKWQKAEENPLEKAVALAKASDMTVLFVGNTPDVETEGMDRESLTLSPSQEELVLAIAETNPKTIVVLHCGAGLQMDKWIERVPGLLLAWFPGQEGGDAIADVLLGNVNPSGKLVTTFFKRWEDCAAYSNYPGTDDEVKYAEGIFVGYRHFDAKGIEPLFPFGYGLSYTDFGYSNLSISPKRIKPGESVAVQFTLKNTGKLQGAEVVQLYLGDEKASVKRPVKELKGFQKVDLKAGEQKMISMTIQPDDLKFFDICTSDWKAEPGKFNVFIGSSSRDIRLKGSFILQ